MNTKVIIKSFIISTFLIFLVLTAGRVYGQSLEVSGNASGSKSSIDIKQKDSKTINQSNSADVDNNVNASSDTGGSSINDGVGGGSITTGDATTKVNINNQFNKNVADVNCKNCSTPTPTPKPSPTQQVGGPVSDIGTSSSGSSAGGSSGNGGSGGGGSAGDPGQAAVKGLSATSGDRSLFTIMAGFMLIYLGYILIRKNAKA